jgi:hypothetical protein
MNCSSGTSSSQSFIPRTMGTRSFVGLGLDEEGVVEKRRKNDREKEEGRRANGYRFHVRKERIAVSGASLCEKNRSRKISAILKSMVLLP